MKKDNQLQTIITQRGSGILLHISSLPGDYGIGDLGSKSYAFVDFLCKAGQTYWQVLPLGPVSSVFGNSPYMSYSAFAGNPLFISPELLMQDGLLSENQIPDQHFSEYNVHFQDVTTCKQTTLQKAWQSFCANCPPDHLIKFIQNHPWVSEYGLFMALKHHFQHKPWYQWPQELSTRQPDALSAARDSLVDQIRYFQFEQWLFTNQWLKLRSYANSKNIRLIGDLPIYVAHDSVDVWANQQIFDLLPDGMPAHVAGVPPDYFSKTGQRWGNPLYRWNSKDSVVYEALNSWWKKRFARLLQTVDLLRIDHFRGFASYWSIPAHEQTAVQGQWKKGPGKQFFDDMSTPAGKIPIIAEDLGSMSPDVEKLRDDLGFPGMKILLFAFDGDKKNPYLPHNHIQNCVVYTGTHDNDTALGWYLNPDILANAKKQAKLYANCHDDDPGNFHQQMMYLAHASTANLAILPMQDVLGFGNDCRFNTPGTTQGNWQWRCAEKFMTNNLAEQLYKSTEQFGRLPAA